MYIPSSCYRHALWFTLLKHSSRKMWKLSLVQCILSQCQWGWLKDMYPTLKGVTDVLYIQLSCSLSVCINHFTQTPHTMYCTLIFNHTDHVSLLWVYLWLCKQWHCSPRKFDFFHIDHVRSSQAALKVFEIPWNCVGRVEQWPWRVFFKSEQTALKIACKPTRFTQISQQQNFTSKLKGERIRFGEANWDGNLCVPKKEWRLAASRPCFHWAESFCRGCFQAVKFPHQHFIPPPPTLLIPSTMNDNRKYIYLSSSTFQQITKWIIAEKMRRWIKSRKN